MSSSNSKVVVVLLHVAVLSSLGAVVYFPLPVLPFRLLIGRHSAAEV